MHQVASELDKAKREPFFDVGVAGRDHRDCPTGDSLQKDILGWLSPPDPWKNHHTACKLRHRGTAEWFIHGNTFPEWKTSEVPSSLLWVHGKRLLIPSFRGSTETNIFLYRFHFHSGRWKKRLLVRNFFQFPSPENLSCSSAPQSPKTSRQCRKLDSRH
jgi:hypothetical protein